MSDIGDQIGRYRIVGPLGKGGMGVVYRAEDTRLQRPVALKFLPPDALDPESRVRLFNEARAAGRIRHPNVCPVYDVDEVDGQAFIALALLEGETLARTLSRGALEPGSAVHIAMQVLAGLQSAHVLGIVHRDIKPGNILIGPSSHVWILDFGLAIHPEMQRLTATGITTGTPAYMSPEQALGQDIDARSDIWSLGVVLFEMLSGATPVRAPNHMALMRAIVETDAPQLSSLRPDLPPRLSAAVEKALARDRTRRWPSSLEFEAELRAVSQELGLPAQVETQTMSVSRLGRKSVRAGVVAGVLVLAAGAGWWWQARRGPSEPAVIANLPPRGSARQIAVLPFQVTSGGDRVRIISDGITELLTESFADAGQGS
ncbi:MAG: serine/threonine-protein kinase, partial [Bryobacteraceae bacterium]|nr:serine/threonine-protein kinase [Bryobacteraceae bacterium]